MTENTTDKNKNKNTHIVCKVFSLLSLNEATRYVRADFNNHLPKEKKKAKVRGPGWDKQRTCGSMS